MSYLERALDRTTGFGIVAGLSILPGLLLGVFIALAAGAPEPLLLATGGPVAAMLLTTPIRHIFLLLARIPFSIIFVGPVLLAYYVLLKPAEWIALRKGWVVRIPQEQSSS